MLDVDGGWTLGDKSMAMTFLSSFRIGQQTLYPEELHERLQGFPLLENVGDGALRNLLSEANWFALPGGTLLDRDGENNAALFLVLTDRWVCSFPTPMATAAGGDGPSRRDGGRDVSHLRRSRSFRPAGSAARYRIAAHQLGRLRGADRPSSQGDDESDAPDGAAAEECHRGQADHARPKTFAIVPLQEGMGDTTIAHRLASALSDMGSRAAVLDVSASDQSAEWFNTFEAAHDVVFYRGDAPSSAWTHHCLRQADRIFLLARADQPLQAHPLDLPAFKERASGLPVLLLLHPGNTTTGLPEHFSVRSGLFESHHHLRAGRADDITRLARFVAGRAVGLVLAGGGARGFAHIGIIRALTEAGVPFDHLGGTSMGAIIAAGLAQEWSLEELTERMRATFVDDNPLSDFTLPLIALVKGKKVSGLLEKNFGDVCIEELQKPFFCVSSDLTTGRIHEHRAGLLWRRCAPPSRCRAFCRRLPIMVICWSMVG